jgi:hypothetical protein
LKGECRNREPQQRSHSGFAFLGNKSTFPNDSGKINMDFFTSAINVLQTLVIALGGGLCIWGGINLLEGYGNDNPGAKSQGIKQLMAGGGVALIGLVLVPLLANLLHT